MGCVCDHDELDYCPGDPCVTPRYIEDIELEASRHSNIINSICFEKRAEYITFGYVRLYIKRIQNIPECIIKEISMYLHIVIFSWKEITDRLHNETIKISVLGALGVGKSSWMITNAAGEWMDGLDPTKQGQYKTSARLNGKSHNVIILDTASDTMEQFPILKYEWIYGANGFVLIYDISSLETFEYIKYVYNTILKSGYTYLGQTNIVLIGNKFDLDVNDNKRQVTKEMAQNLVDLWKYYHCFDPTAYFCEISIKSELGQDEAFNNIVNNFRRIQNDLL